MTVLSMPKNHVTEKIFVLS